MGIVPLSGQWLEALSGCNPLPKMPSATLKFLAKTYNAWHLTMPLLSRLVELHPAESQGYDAPSLA